jgi:hypothetical protein
MKRPQTISAEAYHPGRDVCNQSRIQGTLRVVPYTLGKTCIAFGSILRFKLDFDELSAGRVISVFCQAPSTEICETPEKESQLPRSKAAEDGRTDSVMARPPTLALSAQLCILISSPRCIIRVCIQASDLPTQYVLLSI